MGEQGGGIYTPPSDASRECISPEGPTPQSRDCTLWALGPTPQRDVSAELAQRDVSAKGMSLSTTVARRLGRPPHGPPRVRFWLVLLVNLLIFWNMIACNLITLVLIILHVDVSYD